MFSNMICHCFKHKYQFFCHSNWKTYEIWVKSSKNGHFSSIFRTKFRAKSSNISKYLKQVLLNHIWNDIGLKIAIQKTRCEQNLSLVFLEIGPNIWVIRWNEKIHQIHKKLCILRVTWQQVQLSYYTQTDLIGRANGEFLLLYFEFIGSENIKTILEPFIGQKWQKP